MSEQTPLKSWTDIQADVLALITRAILAMNVVLVVVAILEYWRTGVALNFVTAAAFLSIVVSIIQKKGETPLRRVSASVLFFGVAALVLLQAGAFIGVGFLMIGAVLTTAIFFGERGGYLIYVMFCLLVAAIALTHSFFPIGPQWDLPKLVWMRIGIGMTVGFGSISWILIRMFEQLKSALKTAHQVASREGELNKQKERIVRHAMQVERLESLRILAGGVAHDFNNSLVVIRGGIDMLEEVVPEELELLEMMRESANSAAETARSLTTFSRQSTDKSETCIPSQVAKNLSRRARKLFKSDVQIIWELNETPAAHIGSAHFEEVLLQLLLNATDSCGSDGIVTVRISTTHGNVQVEVSDTGCGIADSDIDRVFEPFFTTKGELATGLGLALVWSHVQRCGGDVHVTSEIEIGTTITFTLPTEKTEDE